MDSTYTGYAGAEKRHGFTLVELLIVIVIIGMLASLVLVAGNSAIQAARRGVVKSDITQLELAIEAYKNKYGEYPPDFSDTKAVMRHVRKRWPRYSVTEQQFFQEMYDSGWEIAEVDNNEKVRMNNGNVVIREGGVGHLGAITFWLGGFRDGGMLGGFSADVSDPFNRSAQREQPMMEFTIDKNVNHDFGVYCFKAYKQPVVYFKADSHGYAQATSTGQYAVDPHSGSTSVGFPRSCDCEDFGCAVPYAKSGSGELLQGNNDMDVIWHNQDKFQLIHPGLDNSFGEGDDDHSGHSHDHYHPLRFANPGNEDFGGCSLADYDNQANFNGTTIEDK